MDELSKLLPRFLSKHVRGDQPPVLEVLAPLWPRVAGRAMAEQSRPVAFGNGTLTVAASSAPWATELRGLHDEIRIAVNRTLGRPLVKRVRVRLTPVGSEDGRDLSGGVGLEREAPSARQDFGILPTPGEAPASIYDGKEFSLHAGLDPETREIMFRSFAKYFGRTNRRVN
ncbi:MAG TPA: DUF721 domain-containing protein [Terriglobia bacterium]|nr:DUF721 domain-containing protein [Terriglobia bacterium]